jgi:hypothetical protein
VGVSQAACQASTGRLGAMVSVMAALDGGGAVRYSRSRLGVKAKAMLS